MSELSIFLPQTGTGGSSGSSSFNTITVNTTTSAVAGEYIFVNEYGEYKTESQLIHDDHIVAKAASTYPAMLCTSLATGGATGSALDFPVVLDPDAYFSTSSNPGIMLNNYSALETYSSKLSGGNWLIFTGFGNQAGRAAQSGNFYSANILSPDGKTLLNSTLFGGSSFNGYATGSGLYNKIVAIVPQASNTAKIYTFSIDWNSGSSYLYSSLLTWTGSAVTVSGTTYLSSIGGWPGSYELSPVITSPIFEYNSITYLAIPYSSNGLSLVNTATNATTNIVLSGTRWLGGSVVHLVKAGTSLHLLTQATSYPTTVIDLVTMTHKTTGISTALTTAQGSNGNIIRLDSTTYAFHSTMSGNFVTVRHSSDGFTATTTSTTPLGSGDTAGAFSYRGKTYLTRTGTWGGYSGSPHRVSSSALLTAPGPLYLYELNYNSAAATCTYSATLDITQCLPDLVGRMPTVIASKTGVVNLASCRYLLTLAADNGASSGATGTLSFHVFNYDHYTKYAPTLIGQALTAGTSPVVLLDSSVKKYTGAVVGTMYADVIGLPSEYAVRLPLQDTLTADIYHFSLTSTSASPFDRTGLVSSDNTTSAISSMGSWAKSTNRYMPYRVIEVDLAMTASNSSPINVISYVSNGMVKKQGTGTSSTAGARTSSWVARTKWRTAWPLVLVLTTGGAQSSGSISISGRIMESFI